MSQPATAENRQNQNSQNREVRNLANLSDSASTSRVLNLAKTYLACRDVEEYTAQPFFRDNQLNKCILIKHTLRHNERELFVRPRRTATKMILPFDVHDLRLGGRSIFIGQKGFDTFCRSFFNMNSPSASADVEILRLLDLLPSLDPFLVREHLNRNGFKIAGCYFRISPSDIKNMVGFANSEIEKLVKNAFSDALSNKALKLTDKILSNELDSELWPLSATLRLTAEEFSSGIFSWRGFLYFKWRYLGLQDEMRKVLQGLASYQPQGQCDDSIKNYLRQARPRLARQIVDVIAAVGRTLSVYDKAYASLTDDGNPGPFRRFLLDGPNLFYELGESIGILGHMGSFWGYRVGSLKNGVRLTPMEYADILMDFEESMAVTETTAIAV